MAHEFDITTYDMMKKSLEKIEYYLGLNEHGVVPESATITQISDEITRLGQEMEEEVDKWDKELEK